MKIFLNIRYYSRINISKGIDLAKNNKSRESIIFHYFFFNHGFKFQDYVCNDCHDLTMLGVNMSVIAIIIVKNDDFCCIVYNISKSEAINLLKKSILENRRVYIKTIVLNFSPFKTVFFFTFLFSICKMVIIWKALSL